MIHYERTEKLLKALADGSRLRILNCIKKEISNPGEIAKQLKRHRSTIEKHLRVLLTANMVEKVPSLTKRGQLSIRYKIRDDAKELVSAIQNRSQKL